MGRLEDIIARNRRPTGLRASIGFVWRGLFLLFILGALIFTDWALTDEARDPPAPQPVAPGARRLDGVPVLRSPARRPEAGQGGGSASAGTPAAPAAPAPSAAPAPAPPR